MSTLAIIALTAASTAAVALLLARRLFGSQGRRLLPEDLGPDCDPLLSLVLRANQAHGVWVWDGGGRGRLRAVVASLGTSGEELIEARLPRLAAQSGSGTELLEHGVLVHVAATGRIAMVLLPSGVSQGGLEAARLDLTELLGRLQREPILASVSRAQGRPEESVESIAMRLAHQVERLLDTEVAVALARPQGVQVLGVSLRSDPRLLLALAAPGSPLDRVGRGIEAGPLVSDDPLGRAGKERRRARPRSVILPIPASDLAVGAVVVSTPEGLLPPGSVTGELLQALHAAGPRLVQALDRQDLHETTMSDPLTGLRNRRGLELALSRVAPGEGALVYADLDRFKLLNDTLGHAAGDSALVYFARVCGQGTRTGDVVARIGGEEFAIWLPGASLVEGADAAERIRAGLEGGAWDWQGTPWSLTASFGVAGCPETVPGVQHLAARADKALYQAKEGGRNRVVTAS
ncbi:MAG: GGDEF domain-containing protein [Gemmatimonadota bacterium]|nr:GGDEF domain-containing protein [Gemmatimonadota bacterium]